MKYHIPLFYYGRNWIKKIKWFIQIVKLSKKSTRIFVDFKSQMELKNCEETVKLGGEHV